MSRCRSLARALLCAALLLVSAGAASAQNAVQIAGTIKDASGGTVGGATVDVVVAGSVTATAASADSGRYSVDVPTNVPFELRVRQAGFADYGAVLRGISAPVTRDIVLQVGGVSDTLVVTASRGAESRANVTSSVSVATADDIHAMGATQLTDVFRMMPGLAVEGNGREGGLTSLFSRGGESDYNLVLIDGVRVNIQGGGFDFSRISAAEIERVEVVRGAQSSLWGSDAIGSVVQIFTKRAGATDAPHAMGSVEGGTFNTVRSDARVLGGLKRRADYAAGVTYRKTDGAFADILPEKDWYEQTAFDGALGVTLGKRVSARTGVRYTHAQGRNVSNITYNLRNTQSQYDTKNLSWHTDVNHTLGSRYSATGTVNVFRYSQLNSDSFADVQSPYYAILEGTPNALFPNGVRLVRPVDQAEFNSLVQAGALPAPGQFLGSATPFSGTSNPLLIPTEFNRPAVRYQGDFDWAGGQRLSAGYEWEREEFVLNPLSPPSAAVTQGFPIDNNAVFIQQQSGFADRVFITVGVRVDDKESYDTFVSPKLSVGGFIVPTRGGSLSSLKVFGNIGKGIKSPGFGERFGSTSSDGNPDLKVERARTGDVGVEATFASQQIRASVTYFDNDYKDQISFRSGSFGDGIPEFINIDGATADGWELEAALQKPVRGVVVSGSYSNVDTKVVTNISTSQQFQPGQPLLRRPRHSGNVRAAYTLGRATVNFDLRIVGDRHDNSFLSLRTVPNAQYLTAFTTDITVNPGYTVAGLGLDYDIAREVSVYIRGNNIGDTEYDSALGYPGLPRTVVVGARFNVGRR